MSSAATCPVCFRKFDGETEATIQVHVNSHLDQDEQQRSEILASVLAALDDDHPQPHPLLPPAFHNQPLHPPQDPLPRAWPASASFSSIRRGRLTTCQNLGTSTTNTTTTTTAEPSAFSSYTHFNPVDHYPPITSPSLRGGLADSAETFVANVATLLEKYYSFAEAVHLRRVHISSDFDLYTTSVAGLGFDCGYRNAAMLLSSLVRHRDTQTVLARMGVRDVPVIMEMQSRIEDAWNKDGFDPSGAEHYGRSLVGHDVWIGACEVVVLLRSLRLRAHVADFELSSDLDKHSMLRWIYDYFDQRCRRPNASNKRQGCLRCRNALFGRRGKLIPPLFLQHQGHSRTIAGVEMTKMNQVRLLIVDPVRSFTRELLSCTNGGSSPLPLVRVDAAGLDKPQYQVVFISESPIIADQEEFDRLKTIVNTLRPEDQGSTYPI